MITAENTIYTTPPKAIGKHEWRCVVFTHSNYGHCTHWQWRKPNETQWRSGYDWPRYDGNDTYNGMPRSLVKIYNTHYASIQSALGKA